MEVAQSYRDRMYKQEEENDEFKGLATQELAKVKHMVRNVSLCLPITISHIYIL